MGTELTYLACSAGLCAFMWVPYVLARLASWGLAATVGYPETPPNVPSWARRLHRAHNNMVENLVPFAALVLVAHAADVSSGMTVFGAALFFYARFAHALVYTLGIPWFRTLAFVGGYLGMLLILVALINSSYI